MRQLLLNIRPHIDCRLDNFVVGDNSQLLASLALHLNKRDGSVLYIWGAASSGRSHLLLAAQDAAAKLGTRPVHYLAKADAEQLAPTPDALWMIDDVDQADAAAQAALFRLLIGTREAGNAVLVAAALPPTALALRDDVSSRLAQGLSFEIKPLNDEQKHHAMRQHSEARGLKMSDDVFHYLLRHGRRDMPWLMAVLDALDEASLTLGRRITLPLVRELLQNTADTPL